MGNVCRKSDRLSCSYAVSSAGNFHFCFAINHKDKCFKRSRVLAQTFAYIKSEERDGAAVVFQQDAAYEAATRTLVRPTDPLVMPREREENPPKLH